MRGLGVITAFAQVPCWRMIGVRTSNIDLFQGLTDFGEWEALQEVDSLTNERTRRAASYLAAVPREHRAYGPGSTYIMAPFAYRAPGRFGDGSFGVLYAALDERTCLAEVGFHRARFYRSVGNPRETSDHQVLALDVTGNLEDLRNQPPDHPTFVDPDPTHYGTAQAFAARLRSEGCPGIAYPSVRRFGGDCIAGFRPSLFSHCRHAKVIQLLWDGHHLLGPDGLSC